MIPFNNATNIFIFVIRLCLTKSKTSQPTKTANEKLIASAINDSAPLRAKVYHNSYKKNSLHHIDCFSTYNKVDSSSRTNDFPIDTYFGSISASLFVGSEN